ALLVGEGDYLGAAGGGLRGQFCGRGLWHHARLSLEEAHVPLPIRMSREDSFRCPGSSTSASSSSPARAASAAPPWRRPWALRRRVAASGRSSARLPARSGW